ncbi:MAG: hypothetical protein H3C53_02730 [Trueperaceae bacterium]|nr:hypothetical protein [Trueperaceae bacterium]
MAIGLAIGGEVHVRLLVRFGLFAVLLGLAVGALLRVTLGRRRFPVVAVLAELPLAAHAAYLLVLAGRAGLAPALMFGFGAAALAVALAAALLARRFTASRPWWVAATPLGAAVVYYLLATFMLTPAWESRAYSPDAVAGAVYGMAVLFVAGVLVPFAPGARGAAAGGAGAGARRG